MEKSDKPQDNTTSNESHTRHLGKESRDYLPRRHTTPLDLKTPLALRLDIDDTDQSIKVPLRQYLIVGRKDSEDDRQVDIDLAPFNAHEHGVSRYHAIIQVVNGRLSIKDFNSSNGTIINNYQLKPMFAYRLRNGDEIFLGKLKVTINFLYADALK